MMFLLCCRRLLYPWYAFFVPPSYQCAFGREDVAQTLGVNVTLVKIVIVSSSTLMTVVSVAVCGIIGWIGLVIPILRVCW
jgi:ABC-type Fe3+-siderophore transport system permease subunit